MDGQMVRLMFDPQFFLAQYQVRNTMKTLCGRYRDVESCGLEEELVTNEQVEGGGQQQLSMTGQGWHCRAV